MKKNYRELFLLFPYNGEVIDGYVVIRKTTFPNDEPPYIMVTYWGVGVNTSTIHEEDGEICFHYLIRQEDAERFVALMNTSQTDYCDGYLEGVYTRNAGEHNMSPDDYARGCYKRPPKVKYMSSIPNIPLSIM